jgi:hypothetical protein
MALDKELLKKYWGKGLTGFILLVLGFCLIFGAIEGETFFKAVATLWIVTQIIKNS